MAVGPGAGTIEDSHGTSAVMPAGYHRASFAAPERVGPMAQADKAGGATL